MENNEKRLTYTEKNYKVHKEVGIIDLDQKDNENAGFPHKCKKCEHDFSEVIDLGVSYSDEAGLFLFKCKKCGHVERDAFGSGNG